MSRAAVARFGAAQTKAGTEQAVTLAEDIGFDQALITAKPPEGKPRLLSYTSQMTPEIGRVWVRVVNYYMTHPTPLGARNALFALALYAPYQKTDKFNGEPMAIATEGPAAVNQKISSVKTSSMGRGYLVVLVKASADLRVTIGKRPFLLRSDRLTTYYMRMFGGGWKLAGWKGNILPHPPRVEK